MPIYDAYIALIQTRVPSLKNIIYLVDLTLCLSCSTAKCERIFSSLKLLKSRFRASLSQENLQAQLQVMVEGPSVAEFKPDLAIDKWLNSASEGKGRHINGHKVCQKKPVDYNIHSVFTDDVYETVYK